MKLILRLNSGLVKVYTEEMTFSAIEKFAKETHRITGYWVAFDFGTRQTLLIDYIQFSAVGSQSSGYGWANYWEQGLLEAGVYMPLSFQKYLQLQKKGPIPFTD